MTDDLRTYVQGHAGRITFARPKALNALNHPMCLTLERALDAWRDDAAVALIVIDAQGERAFCAGGDIAAVYHAGITGDFTTGQQFWRDEYRMNAKIAAYPKPIIAFMQGFVMGGGVGVGAHASHRIIGASTQMAMPESGIGLIPDVGGTYLLAHAPGHIGEYLGVTGARMTPADALYAGFADRYLPEETWPQIIQALCDHGDLRDMPSGQTPPNSSTLEAMRPQIDAIFSRPDLEQILTALRAADSEFGHKTLSVVARNAALSMQAAIQLIRIARAQNDICQALSNEYRFTYRACELAEFLEGVRAQIIDKDRTPHWQDTPDSLTSQRVQALLAPLPAQAGINFGAPAPNRAL
ncbi:enoyl-CoA hydratase [Thioclava sp. SK-1]|uniref:3-hydroxyisobutyryl-CoA hydrolase n=1 Tax=Thioclava sp. SK-1 TaxID=1889770 RepID=UPI000826A70B|nr:3-hydroxyisobutyryl-CoA hydrolase [Thioclava sp. SK-1]OCX67154.1 enoyl-CoA hydratase [Thioclava sp. SK-1]